MTITQSDETSPKNLCERAILEAVGQGPFFAVIRDRKGAGGLAPLHHETAPAVRPKSVVTNEIAAQFEEDRRYGRDLRMKKSMWVFETLLSFVVEVDSSGFELLIAHNPPRFTVHGEGTVLLRVRSVSYKHPAQYGSGSGSEISYVFEADIGR